MKRYVLATLMFGAALSLVASGWPTASKQSAASFVVNSTERRITAYKPTRPRPMDFADGMAYALQQYWQTTYGVSEPLPTITFISGGVCPVGYDCFSDYFLATYSEGDGAGTGIFRQSETSPDSFGVLYASGGKLDLPGVESLGFDPVTAASLLAGV